ncbi:MAG: hypothetical protein PHU44_19155 [Syntrophales bacterium]|nr:hypothetical protein [Syntrophales bacterium]
MIQFRWFSGRGYLGILWALLILAVVFSGTAMAAQNFINIIDITP